MPSSGFWRANLFGLLIMPTVVAVGTSLPDFVVTNDHVVSLTIENSKHGYEGDLAELEKNATSFLEKIGAKQRRWRSAGTRPIEHIFEAWSNCLSSIDGNTTRKIGTLVYCGIDKGIAEPSHASLMAKKFGLRGVRTFDVSDACMGWVTAAQIAARFATREQPYSVVVSAEFPIEFPGKVFPASFKIRSHDDFHWKAAALTLGECASVTLIEHGTGEDHYSFKSDNDFSDICAVPLIRPDRFVDSSSLNGRFAEDCFVADMGRLATATYRDSQNVLRDYVARNGAPDILLPHTVSQNGPGRASKGIIKEGVLQNCFEQFGNIATSAIPAGYQYFDCANRKKAHIAGWVSAAGLSHCAFRIS
jgi:3-oxoacyl-[acyl-carrier-protein] synthase III